ncbi:hypothetical protein CDAR_97591 [Caerostris darwini]|uniref:Secreted protein n=1 Tax=Caerostris darwini TaxID=1538125 RepID=A0AAV4NHP8_9ARAC|nr:hypothetical protein CDAR_97591 [Caerostris darwini]
MYRRLPLILVPVVCGIKIELPCIRIFLSGDGTICAPSSLERTLNSLSNSGQGARKGQNIDCGLSRIPTTAGCGSYASLLGLLNTTGFFFASSSRVTRGNGYCYGTIFIDSVALPLLGLVFREVKNADGLVAKESGRICKNVMCLGKERILFWEWWL